MYVISTSDSRRINGLRPPHPIQKKRRFSLHDKNTQTSLFVCNIHRLYIIVNGKVFKTFYCVRPLAPGSLLRQLNYLACIAM